MPLKDMEQGDFLENMFTLQQLGVLDGDKTDDQVNKLLLMMQLNQNKYMRDMREYIKESKRGDGDGRGSRVGRERSGRGGRSGEGSFFSLLQGFNAMNLVNILNRLEGEFAAIQAGPDLNEIASGYNLNQWGTNAVNDRKLIAYLLNTVGYMAQLIQTENVAERAESTYALLEAFDGERTWGNLNNGSAGLLPLMLLQGGGGIFGNIFSTGTFVPMKPRFSA